jgi:hypothetical protein
MSYEAESALLYGREPGGRRWEAHGHWAWDYVAVGVGQVRDRGRWYVERHSHPQIGPYRAELYATEAQALAVAVAVMAEVSAALDGREFVEIV